MLSQDYIVLWLNSHMKSMHHSSFIHSSVAGPLAFSHFLAIMNSAVINMGVWMSVYYSDFFSLHTEQ
jgi:hypothetical protein